MKTKKKKDMIEALKEHLGNITLACQKVGINRKTHYEWLKKDSEYKRLVEEVPERTLDFVENALFKNISEGNVVAQIFYLKTKGKSRGYIEKQEIEHTTGNQYVIEVTKHAKKRKKKDKNT
jgi:hypothetical protein